MTINNCEEALHKNNVSIDEAVNAFSKLARASQKTSEAIINVLAAFAIQKILN